MKSLFACLLIVSSSAVASATEIPLPALIGNYDDDSGYSRSVIVGLDVAPSTVESLALYLKGRTTTGQLICFGSDEPSMYPVELHAYIHDPIADAYWYVDEIVPELGEPLQSYDFEMTTTFRSFRKPSWDFLESGPFKIEFSAAGPPYIAICTMDQAPVTVIDRAVLIVNLVAHYLPIESKSWGGIKELY